MKRWMAVLWVFLHACATGKLMSMGQFYSIPLGTKEEAVVEEFGSPEAVTEEEGQTCYYYVERLTNGFRVIEERYYKLMFVNGKLVEKGVSQENTPPYQLNSYDLQTTYGDETPPDEN
ncbi:MAG: hypothetical protein AAGF04_05345 [Chlamydiota bacterium]